MALRAIVSGALILTYGLLLKPSSDLWPNRWPPHLIRGGMACIAMLLSYIAFARLPVAQAQALMFLSPLIAVPLAAYLLKERLSLAIFGGLSLGLLGMCFILGVSIQTGATAMWGVVSGVAAAFFIAAIQITIRNMMGTETAISTALSFTLIVAVVSALSIFWGNWIWPQGATLWIVLGAGIFGALNLVLFAESLARAPVTTLAPLDYTGLIWALLVDWFIFAVQPSGLSLVGSVLVTLGALIVVLKPRRT